MRTVIAVAMMLLAAFLVLKWVRELWVNQKRPREFGDLVKSKMSYGEEGNEVSRSDRLYFSYPFLIVGFGAGGWLLAHQP
jgi:hypothetical protein